MKPLATHPASAWRQVRAPDQIAVFCGMSAGRCRSHTTLDRTNSEAPGWAADAENQHFSIADWVDHRILSSYVGPKMDARQVNAPGASRARLASRSPTWIPRVTRA